MTRLAGRPWRRIRQAVLYHDRTCHLCGGAIDVALGGMHPMGPTVDHIVPVAHGGSNHPDNLAPAHRICNLTKGAGRTRTDLTW